MTRWCCLLRHIRSCSGLSGHICSTSRSCVSAQSSSGHLVLCLFLLHELPCHSCSVTTLSQRSLPSLGSHFDQSHRHCSDQFSTFHASWRPLLQEKRRLQVCLLMFSCLFHSLLLQSALGFPIGIWPHLHCPAVSL